MTTPPEDLPDSPGPADPAGAPGPDPGNSGAERLKAVLAALAVVFLVASSLVALMLARIDCMRRRPAIPTVELPAPMPDSAAVWADRADSLLAADLSVRPELLDQGADLWARAVCSLLRVESDTLQPLRVQSAMDSLHIPGEVRPLAGELGGCVMEVHPRSALRARREFALVPVNGRVTYLRTGGGLLSDPRYITWVIDSRAQFAMVGVRRDDEGASHVELRSLSLLPRTGWTPWDSLPPPEAFGPGVLGAEFTLVPGTAPFLVVRAPVALGIFEERPGGPRRSVERLWRAEGRTWVKFTDQPGSTNFDVLANFMEALSARDRQKASGYAAADSVLRAAEALNLDHSQSPGSWQVRGPFSLQDTVALISGPGGRTLRVEVHPVASHWLVTAVGLIPH